MTWLAFSWRRNAGGTYDPALLQTPPGYDMSDNGSGSIWTQDCSDDGRLVAGYYSMSRYDDDVVCIWYDGMIQDLVQPPGSPSYDVAWPTAVSADGRVVVGAKNNSELAVWFVSGGVASAGVKPAPYSGYTSSVNDHYNKCFVSDDGTKIVGWCYASDTPPYPMNTVWISGVPNALGITQSQTNGVYACGISGDGSTVFGTSYTSGYGTIGIWRGGQFRLIRGVDVAGAPSYTSARVKGINYNGTILYGTIRDQYGVTKECYWDNLDTVTGTYNWTFTPGPTGVRNLYGTLHILFSPAHAQVRDYAKMSATPLCAGQNWNQIFHSVRWEGETYINLQPNPLAGGPWPYGSVDAMNGDGSIMAAQCLEPVHLMDMPGYFTASDRVWHMLPMPPGFTELYTISNAYVMDLNTSGDFMHGSGYFNGFSTDSATLSGWQIQGFPGGVGDIWEDPRYVDFDDPEVRAGFINPDDTWLTLGTYGDWPLGDSPVSWLTAQDSIDPYRIIYGFGGWGGQWSWDTHEIGTDPLTGEAYPPLQFDVCEVVDVPDPPDGACGPHTRTSITATWNPVEGAVSYTLRYRVGTAPWTVISGLHDTSRVIGGFMPGTRVEWQVAVIV